MSTIKDIATCLQGRLPEAPIWEHIILEANERLVTPALYEALRDAQQLQMIPGDVSSYLELIYQRNSSRNRRLKQQAIEAVIALNEVGVEPLALKGTIALLTWPEAKLGSRIMMDIDLCIEKERLETAFVKLQALGYRIHSTDEGPHAFASLYREQDAATIDLHHQPAGPPELLQYVSSAMAEPCEIDGARLCVPAALDRIILLVAHDMIHDSGFRNGSFDLRHLLDAREVFALEPKVDWNALQDCFRTGTLPWILEVFLLNMQHLLDAKPSFDIKAGRMSRLLFKRQIYKSEHKWVRLLDDLVTPGASLAWRILKPLMRSSSRLALSHINGIKGLT